MAKISLKTIIDDILLLVRNNNISESEDLSRAQIHAWVKAYKHKLWKDEKDRKKQLALVGQLLWEDLIDDEFVKKLETGPMQLEPVQSNDDRPSFTKRTVDALEGVLNNSEVGILAIYDESGENIQYMNHIRRHYNYWRKYTFGEMTGYYKDDGHIYIEGLVDKDQLQYIYVLWLKEVDDEEGDTEDLDEEDIEIPAWMVPGIKDLIMKNELSFMLNRSSDDSNNATLASVKPHGPQDDEE
jgi:hypothetical protein